MCPSAKNFLISVHDRASLGHNVIADLAQRHVCVNDGLHVVFATLVLHLAFDNATMSIDLSQYPR